MSEHSRPISKGPFGPISKGPKGPFGKCGAVSSNHRCRNPDGCGCREYEQSKRYNRSNKKKSSRNSIDDKYNAVKSKSSSSPTQQTNPIVKNSSVRLVRHPNGQLIIEEQVCKEATHDFIECELCNKYIPNTMFFPCGHDLCSECAIKYQAANASPDMKCPFCQTEIEMVTQVPIFKYSKQDKNNIEDKS
jgi:hypothetical protein